MFDNPKKELERLQEQLLEAERKPAAPEYPDVLSDDDLDIILNDPELFPEEEEDDSLLYEQQTLGRSAGFDADVTYEMDDRRYVAPPKKRGMGCFVFIAVLEAILAIALAAWWLGHTR